MDELNPELREFIKFNVPYATIEPGKYTDIPVDQFDRLTKQIEDLQSEIQLSKEAAEEETRRLTAKVQEAEAAKLKQMEDSQKEHERTIAEMKKQIQQQEQKMRDANEESRKSEDQASSVIFGKLIRNEIGSGIFSSGSVQNGSEPFSSKMLHKQKKDIKKCSSTLKWLLLNDWNRFRAELNRTDSETKFQFGSSLTEDRLHP